MLPGLLALQVVFAGAFGIATLLATEREDGTLLRLKAVPYGTVGYVAGQLVRVCIEIALQHGDRAGAGGVLRART